MNCRLQSFLRRRQTVLLSWRFAVRRICDLPPRILRNVAEQAPNLRMQLEAEFDAELTQKMRYQEVDFVIDYVRFDESGFCSTELFSDELVVVAAGNHPPAYW